MKATQQKMSHPGKGRDELAKEEGRNQETCVKSNFLLGALKVGKTCSRIDGLSAAEFQSKTYLQP
jgi:hypothetical protein